MFYSHLLWAYSILLMTQAAIRLLYSNIFRCTLKLVFSRSTQRNDATARLLRSRWNWGFLLNRPQSPLLHHHHAHTECLFLQHTNIHTHWHTHTFTHPLEFLSTLWNYLPESPNQDMNLQSASRQNKLIKYRLHCSGTAVFLIVLCSIISPPSTISTDLNEITIIIKKNLDAQFKSFFLFHFIISLCVFQR